MFEFNSEIGLTWQLFGSFLIWLKDLENKVEVKPVWIVKYNLFISFLIANWILKQNRNERSGKLYKKCFNYSKDFLLPRYFFPL
jgi:hypothetical protein